MNVEPTPQPLFAAAHLSKVFHAPRRRFFQPKQSVNAVVDANLEIFEGSSLAIVGESGSGKSTLLRLLLGLEPVSGGEVTFRGRPVSSNPRDRLLWLRRETGIVFQDPFTSLNPRMTVGDIIAEPMRSLEIDGDHSLRVAEMLERVQLDSESIHQYPHEFSGGQRQRIALARALVHRPRVLIGDEPMSALDVIVRAQMVQLLNDLRDEMNLALVTVTHDLGLVPSLATRIAIMHQGRIIETGVVSQVMQSPREDYTRELIRAVPRLPEAL